ncbi:MAG: hypothetical protein KC561_05515, partial [Myxococcales bacterium]|nr:hypothetical protein [Myxococcales bacterium]
MRKQKQILKGGIRGEVARTLCGLLWVLAIFSCDRSEVSPEATTGPATQGPEATPGESDDGSSEHPRTTAFRSSLPDSLDLDTPVARMGTEEILAEDLERKILQISLYEGIPAAQMFSQEQLRDPFVLHSLVEQILQDRALYEQGELLGILPTETEVMAAWHADPTLAEVELPGAEVSGRFPDGRVRLTREQVLRPLLLQVLHGRWTERQVENVTEDTVRNEWFFENQSISVTSYEIRNVATRDDVDAFLRNPPSEAWFEEQYDARRAMFRRPESVDLRVVGVSVERPDGEARIREMRDRVLLGADMVRMSMVESDHPASATEGLIQAVRRDESPEVYSAELGAVGEVRREGEYWLFERVEAVQPAGYAPLDDEAKRRLVSAYLAFHEPLERYQSAAVSIREALESGDQEALQAIL